MRGKDLVDALKMLRDNPEKPDMFMSVKDYEAEHKQHMMEMATGKKVLGSTEYFQVEEHIDAPEPRTDYPMGMSMSLPETDSTVVEAKSRRAIMHSPVGPKEYSRELPRPEADYLGNEVKIIRHKK